MPRVKYIPVSGMRTQPLIKPTFFSQSPRIFLLMSFLKKIFQLSRQKNQVMELIFKLVGILKSYFRVFPQL